MCVLSPRSENTKKSNVCFKDGYFFTTVEAENSRIVILPLLPSYWCKFQIMRGRVLISLNGSLLVYSIVVVSSTIDN